MKKISHILSVLILLSIYCTGVSFTLPNSIGHLDQVISTSSGEDEKIISFSGTSLLHASNQGMSITEVLENFDVKPLPHFDDMWANQTSVEVRLFAFYNQYKRQFNTTLISKRKADLMFPFHNFW